MRREQAEPTDGDQSAETAAHMLRLQSKRARRGPRRRVQRAGDDDLAVGRRRQQRGSPRPPRPCRRPRCGPRGSRGRRPPSAIDRRIERARARRPAAHDEPRRRRRRRARRASRAVPSRAAARRRACAAPVANSSASAARNACAPATLCAPSSSTSGCRPDDFEPARRTARARTRRRTTSSASGAPTNASAAVERDRRVVGLVRAVQREEHLGVARARRVAGRRTRPPTASTLRAHAEVGVAPEHRAPARGRVEDRLRARDRSRRARASHPASRCRPSRARSPRAVVPRYSTWSMLTFVTTATRPSTTLVASHVPPSPTSTHRDVDRHVGEPAERGRRDDLEVRRVEPDSTPRRARPTCSISSSSSSVIGSPSIDDALVDALEVRARVRAGREADGRRAARVIIARRRRLAVRAREVDRPGYSSCGEPRYCSSVLMRSSVGRAAFAAPAGTPTPVSRLTCASSQAEASKSAGEAHARVGSVRARPRRERVGRPRSSSVAILPASRTSARRGAERGERARRCRARTTWSTGVASDTLLLRLRLAHRGEHLGRDREHERVGVGEAARRRRPATRRGAPSPSCHHDHTSSVTNGRTGANSRSSARARCAARPRPNAAASSPIARTRDPSRARRSRRRTTRRTARCVRARGRSRTRRTQSVASSTSSASASSIDRSSGSVTDRASTSSAVLAGDAERELRRVEHLDRELAPDLHDAVVDRGVDAPGGRCTPSSAARRRRTPRRAASA